MKRSDRECNTYLAKGQEISFSNAQLIELVRSVLARGALFRFRAGGWSMNPFIKDGDILLLTKVTVCPDIGDVVAFIHPVTGRLVVHRIVGMSDGACILRGDNCMQIDGVVYYQNMVGKVTRIERDGKVIRFGLGAEKRPIAFMSRLHLLKIINGHLSTILNLIRKLHL